MSRAVLDAIRHAAVWSAPTTDGFDSLLESIGDDARLVLIGEASHGTHEFYKIRAELTKACAPVRSLTRLCTSMKPVRSNRSKHGRS